MLLFCFWIDPDNQAIGIEKVANFPIAHQSMEYRLDLIMLMGPSFPHPRVDSERPYLDPNIA